MRRCSIAPLSAGWRVFRVFACPVTSIDQILTYDIYIDIIFVCLRSPKILKTRVKVSPKFQIVIPKAIREEMKLEPGQELFMYLYEGKLHLDTLRPVTRTSRNRQGDEMERRLS